MSCPHRQLAQNPPLEVICEGFLEAVLDSDEFEALLEREDYQGQFHAGVQYRFSQRDRKADARRYDDQPGEVCVCLSRTPEHIPYYDPFLAAIVQHLQEETPAPRIRLLCRKGYRDIDIHRLLNHQGPEWHFVGWFWDNPWRPFILFALIAAAALMRAFSIIYSR